MNAACLALAGAASLISSSAVNSARTWLDQERDIALQKMFANISPAGTSTGVVVASPQRANPDYYFHWVRDAGLTMDTVVTLHSTTNDPIERGHYRTAL